MATARFKIALTILAVFLIAIIPAFYVTGSLVDTFCFLLVCAPMFYADLRPITKAVFSYHNPLKIVDGRYGMSGAWVGAAPIGYILGNGFAVHLLSSLNNYVIYLKHG